MKTLLIAMAVLVGMVAAPDKGKGGGGSSGGGSGDVLELV